MTPTRIDSRYSDPATVTGARTLMRLDHVQVGADIHNRGNYAVYFYDLPPDDPRSVEIRSVGGFPTVGEAAAAIPYIRAEQVIEDVEVDRAEVEESNPS